VVTVVRLHAMCKWHAASCIDVMSLMFRYH
jgi:hypothetical protein